MKARNNHRKVRKTRSSRTRTLIADPRHRSTVEESADIESQIFEVAQLGLVAIERRIEREPEACLKGTDMRVLRDLLRHTPEDADLDLEMLEQRILDLLSRALLRIKSRLLDDPNASITGPDLQVMHMARRIHASRVERAEEACRPERAAEASTDESSRRRPPSQPEATPAKQEAREMSSSASDHRSGDVKARSCGNDAHFQTAQENLLAKQCA